MQEKKHPYNSLKVETIVSLNKFVARDYQIPIMDAIENKGYKKLVVVMGRRAGKDMVCFNIVVRQALKRVGIYYYLLPTAVQARRVMFAGMTSTGQPILDFIPKELIKSINIQQMLVTLVNNSQIMFCGSENYDALRGTNPVGIVMSEAAYSHPAAYPALRPILLYNDGFIIFISTPFGSNWFSTIHEIAKNNPDEWFSYFAPVDVTQHISEDQIRAEIESGEISPDLARQEYWCDFSTGAVGSFYATYLNRMELNNQIGDFEWEPNFPVFSSWDLGVRDTTVILMFQLIGRSIHIIDMYYNTSVGLEHYVNVLQNKEYIWGKHVAPHDIQVREFTAGGLSRLEKAAQLGFRFAVSPHISLMDGIECVRTTLPRIYIDQKRCKKLIDALRNYRREYDEKRKVYKPTPLHDENSHFCDALRYLCLSLPLLKSTSNPVELEKRYNEARYGSNINNGFFRDDLPSY